jgi:hypothetical protein
MEHMSSGKGTVPKRGNAVTAPEDAPHGNPTSTNETSMSDPAIWLGDNKRAVNVGVIMERTWRIQLGAEGLTRGSFSALPRECDVKWTETWWQA